MQTNTIIKLETYLICISLQKSNYHFVYNSSSEKQLGTQMKEKEKLKLFTNKNNQKSTQNRHKHQQHLGLATHQQPLKSLLYRNRSLKLLFGSSSSAVRQQIRIQNCSNSQNSTKNQLIVPSKTNNNFKVGNQKLGSSTKDQYLLNYKKHYQNELDERDSMIRKKEEMRSFNTFTKKCKISQFPQATKNAGNTNYDPEIYNWRKKIKQERRIKTKQNDLNSPRQSKICFSEYYGASVQYKPQEEKQKGNFQRKRDSRQDLQLAKKNFRSKSLNYKPKVIKNVFQIRSPKAKQQPLSPKKSFEFTFGI